MTTAEKPDVIELLVAQHQHIRDLFADVESASGAAKQAKFEELRRFLAVHETAEELITHPRVRMSGANDVVDARLEEETESKKLLAAMDGMDVSETDFDPRLRTLRIAVLAHADAEEREEFPLLREAADDRQLRVMALALQAVEAIAPTHPHPSVGSSMTTNLMAGPLASVVDRTRDAVAAVLRKG
ncbi:hemerythrin domain-containing protein [Nocardioides houyundeii]|uniref:hemerythrin domain-containing protein n=1 Tax=Nocardioides houyundeii TaxID=2045452 RepID=UPI000DF314D8|nr:hemerythrin domain-containing protein [Nocardioides houyundeii]